MKNKKEINEQVSQTENEIRQFIDSYNGHDFIEDGTTFYYSGRLDSPYLIKEKGKLFLGVWEEEKLKDILESDTSDTIFFSKLPTFPVDSSKEILNFLSKERIVYMFKTRAKEKDYEVYQRNELLKVLVEDAILSQNFNFKSMECSVNYLMYHKTLPFINKYGYLGKGTIDVLLYSDYTIKVFLVGYLIVHIDSEGNYNKIPEGLDNAYVSMLLNSIAFKVQQDALNKSSEKVRYAMNTRKNFIYAIEEVIKTLYTKID